MVDVATHPATHRTTLLTQHHVAQNADDAQVETLPYPTCLIHAHTAGQDSATSLPLEPKGPVQL